jgi:hypothetical protein
MKLRIAISLTPKSAMFSRQIIRVLLYSLPLFLGLFVGPALVATTLDKTEVTCAVCGTKSEQTVVMSTNTMGAPDLDLRPAEMRRSTMSFWVQECPKCGYCNGELGELEALSATSVKAENYRAQLKNSAFPPLANRFSCQMLVCDKSGAERAAIYAALCAAWACDDEGKTEAATQARTAAVERLERMKAKGLVFYEQQAADEILLADLVRRNGQFSAAAQFAKKGLDLKPEGIVSQVLTFELKLAEQKDSLCHTVGDLPKPAEKHPDGAGAPSGK